MENLYNEVEQLLLEKKYLEAKKLCQKYIGSLDKDLKYDALKGLFSVYNYIGSGFTESQKKCLEMAKQIKSSRIVEEDFKYLLPSFYFRGLDFDNVILSCKNFINMESYSIFWNLLVGFAYVCQKKESELKINWAQLIEKIRKFSLYKNKNCELPSLKSLNFELFEDEKKYYTYYDFFDGTQKTDDFLLVIPKYIYGLGDVINGFVFLKKLAEKKQKIIFYLLEKHKSLKNLLENNLPSNVVVIDDFSNCDVTPSSFIPLIFLQINPEYQNGIQVKKDNPIIKPDIKKVEDYKQKYFNNNKVKIAIKWKGDPESERNIPIKYFENLFDIENVEIYSFQKGTGVEELELLDKKFKITNMGETFDDFSDTAAAMQNIDLLISNDTSLLHLAGAMGKPCYALVKNIYDARWYLDLGEEKYQCSSTTLYESVSLFRQKEVGNWAEVMDRVVEQVKIFCKDKV